MTATSQTPTVEEIARILRVPPSALPEAPIVVAPFLDAIHDASSNAGDLVAILETEPELFQNMLHRLNSQLRKEPILSMRQAVVVLGYEKLASLAMETLFYRVCIQPQQESSFDIMLFWRHSLTVAILAAALAERVEETINPQEAYLAGLGHDMGKWFLDRHGQISQQTFHAIFRTTSGPQVERERLILGMGHDDVGSFLLDQWGFPPHLTEAVRLHHRGCRDERSDRATWVLTMVLQLADFLAWAQGIGSVASGCGPALTPECHDMMALVENHLPHLLKKVDRGLREAADYYGFPFPSPAQVRENLLRTNIQLGRMNAQLAADLKRYDGKPFASDISHALLVPHRSLDAQVILRTSLEAIRKDFPFVRVALFGFEDDRRRLVLLDRGASRRAAGLPKGLRIPLTDVESGFRDCLRQRKPVVLRRTGPLERELLKRFGCEAMGLVPVLGNHAVHGLVAVDNAGNGADLDPNWLRDLATVGREMGLALDQAGVHRKVRDDAALDSLTGLWNRGRIEAHLDKSFAHARKNLESLSVALLDVDFFKGFNDRFGHQEGDRILKLMAGVLKKLSRTDGRVGRFGGEEFLVVLPRSDLHAAVLYCERIRKAVEEVGLVLGKRLPGRPLTVSIGVASLGERTNTLPLLLGQADRMLYIAKEGGRNRVVGATPTLARVEAPRHPSKDGVSPVPRRRDAIADNGPEAALQQAN